MRCYSLNGKDYLFVCSGHATNGAGGWALTGLPYAMVLDQGISNNKIVAQHEIGHTYSLEHCSENCVMNGDAPMYNNFNQFCVEHHSTLYTEWARFGTIS